MMGFIFKLIERAYLSFEYNKVVIDALTQTYNKNYIVYNKSELDKYVGFIHLVDMNNFKEINDKYGHSAGDKKLVEVSTYLKSKGDVVIRYGGDEFIVLSKTLISDENNDFAIGVCYKSYDYDFNEAIKIADEDMYKKKKLFYTISGTERRKQ